ncbi:MAG: hypothetical protein IJ482_07610 [Alphaproteobacteria bacterium]|nr:hypothetical protein [Alphaproteobacteria bacterium]
MQKYQASINNGAYEYIFDSFSDTVFGVTIKRVRSNDSLSIDVTGMKIEGLPEKLKIFFENYLIHNDLESLRLYVKSARDVCIDDISFNFSLSEIKIY